MNFRRQVPLLIALLANGILWLLVMELNHVLAIWSLAVMLPVAFVLFAGLNLQYWPGFFVAVLSGLMQDAVLPISHGYFILVLPIIHLVIHLLRGKLHKTGGLDSVILAQSLNLSAILLLGILFSYRTEVDWIRNLPRFLVEVLLSQLFLLVGGGYFLELQRKLTAMLGVEFPDKEAQPG